MATTKDFQKTQWDTLHRNGPFPLKLLQVTELEGKANMPSSLDRYNDAAKEIQRLITEAHNNGHGFRPYGSRWSMSSIAHQKDRMHFNSHMNIDLPVQPGEVHSSSSYHHSNLFFMDGLYLRIYYHQTMIKYEQ